MGYIREIMIAAPADKVFAAWTDATTAAKWLCRRANLDPKVGGVWEFFWDENPEVDSTKGCRLLEIEAPHRLLFEWRGKSDYDDLFDPPNGPTTVEVRFVPRDGVTHVTVEQRETRSLDGWAAYDEWMADAWEEGLQGLKRHFEGA